jgi:hypothetical protein
MVSELNFAVTAEVVLFDRNGAQITSQTVAFPAHSRQALLVGDLFGQADSAETMGSVEVLPNPAQVVTMAIAAQLSITGSGANMGQQIEEEFLMARTQGLGVLRSGGCRLGEQSHRCAQKLGAGRPDCHHFVYHRERRPHPAAGTARSGRVALLKSCTSSYNAAASLIGDAPGTPVNTVFPEWKVPASKKF